MLDLGVVRDLMLVFATFASVTGCTAIFELMLIVFAETARKDTK